MSAYSIATRGLAGRKVPQGVLTPMGDLLFASSEPGAWYDPSDMSTLFQDSAGTTPVTAVEQPVGRMLDKSGRGNHATQSTTTKRPVLSRRVNLLTNSEFVGAVAGTPGTPPTGWSNGAVTGALVESATGIRFVTDGTRRTINSAFSVMPNGVIVARVKGVVNTTGVSVQVSSIVGNPHPAVIVGVSYKVNGVAVAVNYVMPVGAFDIECTLTASASGGSSVLQVGLGVQAASTGDVTLLTASLTLATDAHLPYQRVNTDTDYDADPSKFPAYLRFDGVDDALQTGNIDFTSTDKMTVWAGAVFSLSANQMLVNHNGTGFRSFWILTISETSIASAAVGLSSTGQTLSPYPDHTITTQYDLSSGAASVRVDGADAGSTVTPVGGGWFASAPLGVGAQENVTRFFNGRLYSLIVRGAQTPLSQIEATELYIKQKMRLP